MSSAAKDLRIGFRQIVFLASIVLLSIVLPIGIVIWSVNSAISGKPFGQPSNEYKDYFGVLHGGELYFPVVRYLGKTKSPPVEWRIKRLDLETGVERESGIVTGNERCWPCVVNGEVYGSGSNAVYKMVGSTLIKVSAEHEKSPIYCAQVFEFNGQLTNAIETADGEFQLCHLIDGNWINGRKIRVPKRGSVWIDDHGRLKLQSPDASMRALSAGNSLVVSVVQLDGKDHVSVTDSGGPFAAYRIGLEFVDSDQGNASASNPENDDQDLSGWEPIQPRKPDDLRWDDLHCDRDGVLFSTWPRQGRVVRRSADGHWEDLKGLGELEKTSERLAVASPIEARSYLVDKNQFSAVFYRIEGNVVHPPHLILNGCGTEYLARCQRLFVGLFVAWLMHLGVLFVGVAWLERSACQFKYRFGNHCATLASTHRRALAEVIDFLILAVAVFLLAFAQAKTFGLQLQPFTECDVCNCLLEYEQSVSISIGQGFDLFFINLRGATRMTLAMLFGSYKHGSAFLFTIILQALCLVGLKSSVEGRSGITPGKWLFGIRTLRSTLLPCGLARALTGNVLLWIDIPFFMTPIPAAVSMMLSRCRQRIGDRVADTLVVNKSSIGTEDKRVH